MKYLEAAAHESSIFNFDIFIESFLISIYTQGPTWWSLGVWQIIDVGQRRKTLEQTKFIEKQIRSTFETNFLLRFQAVGHFLFRWMIHPGTLILITGWRNDETFKISKLLEGSSEVVRF